MDEARNRKLRKCIRLTASGRPFQTGSGGATQTVIAQDVSLSDCEFAFAVEWRPSHSLKVLDSERPIREADIWRERSVQFYQGH